jgi:hypothetical protein
MSWSRNTGFQYDGGSKKTKLAHHREKSKIFHEVEEQDALWLGGFSSALYCRLEKIAFFFL